MRVSAPLFFFLAAAAFYSTLSASLESEEKDKIIVAARDDLAELQKIDQMEFEAAQKNEGAHVNVTEEQKDDTRRLEAAQDGSVEERSVAENHSTEGGGNSDSATREEQHDGKQETVSSVDETSQDSTKEQDAPE
ncbi:uncharacterized protein si:dkey-200l5.4 isoform X5 [Antennarius striatus]|uniref:uncharacterized protein si:dkey-200l5.4 isoform X5 n=1 Tax=Antennarius striatus TaxID=241820 RepID=UPI0035B0E936